MIQEINSAGTVVFSWSAAAHFPDTDSTFPNRFDIALYNGAPGVVDLHHLNGLERINDGTGDYLVTARHLDAAFRINRSNGSIKWIVGGREAPKPDWPSSTTLSAAPPVLTTPGSTATC